MFGEDMQLCLSIRKDTKSIRKGRASPAGPGTVGTGGGEHKPELDF